MHVALTPEHVELRSAFRRWIDRQDPVPLRDARRRGDHEVLRRWQRRLYDDGWLGFGWPSEHGGRGHTVVEHAMVTREIAVRGLPQPLGLIGLEIVGPSLLEYGTPAQQRRYVPPLLRGDELWCQGFSEPEAGSDLASLRTRAVATGDHLVVSGQKIWTSYGAVADRCALLARTDPDAPKHEGISYLLVDMHAEGVTVRPIEQATGEREFVELFLEEVTVPSEDVLGPLHGGWRVATSTLDAERGPFTLRRHAELHHLFDRIRREMEHVERDVEQPIETARVGAAVIALDVLEAQCFRILQRLATGATSAESSIDKLVTIEVEQQLGHLALDALAPRRTSAGSDREDELRTEGLREYLFSRAASIYGGTSQVQQQIVARRILELPRGDR